MPVKGSGVTLKLRDAPRKNWKYEQNNRSDYGHCGFVCDRLRTGAEI